MRNRVGGFVVWVLLAFAIAAVPMACSSGSDDDEPMQNTGGGGSPSNAPDSGPSGMAGTGPMSMTQS